MQTALHGSRTNNHNIEVESLSDTLSVPLVWQVCKTNITRQLSSNNVPHVASLLRRDLRVGGGNALRHLHLGSMGFAIWDRAWRSGGRCRSNTICSYIIRVSKY